MVSNLGKKRFDALFEISRYAVSGGAVSALPLPGTELPKQIALTASDIFMYAKIWKRYFDEDLSDKELHEILGQFGLITIAAGGTTYLVLKSSSAIITEITNRFGPVGWGVSAAVTGSLTGLCGLAWLLYCDRLYCDRKIADA
ncbi:MAG: hypothetical protein QNJ54_00310 [Prochloraceae cyanobacterium]|nr:hypothetical protein [Prochloraceae cyanobacterium]